jgi:hypothetical protein
MAPVLPDKIWRMADHPLVIDLSSLDLKNLASVMTSGASIRVFSDNSLCSKWLGKTLGTNAIDHAGSTVILIATGCVNHELLDELKEFIIGSGELRRHKTVNILWSAQLGMRLEKDNDMGMRKATLLKLYGVEIGRYFPQHTPGNVL